MTVADELFTQMTRAVNAHQPELAASCSENIIILDGPLVVSIPKGPFDYYQVRLGVPVGLPWKEPIVLETGGRIPKLADRHVLPKEGICCLRVWEEWLLTVSDPSFENLLTGQLHDSFVCQSWFEAKGEWPYGRRSHERQES